MLTQQRLQEKLVYDPDTGVFTARKNGRVAGTWHTKGYRTIFVDSKSYKAQRLAFLYMTGEWPTEQVDHVNRVRSDNRWANLRNSNSFRNQKNRTPQPEVNKLGFVGVSRAGRKFRAKISVDNKRLHLGCFDTPEEASEAYQRAKQQHHDVGV